MSARSSREEDFIAPFLSAYEDGTWADAETKKPDSLDRVNPAVDKLAIRKLDGKVLAIEHTIIEPFIGDKEDFAFFEETFLKIEADRSLVVPGRWIQVFVPVGSLRNQPQKIVRNAIAQSVHGWIRSNRLALRDGMSQHQCAIADIPGLGPSEITLTVRVDNLQDGPVAESGILHVRRQKVEDNLGEVIERALRKKLPKLVNTAADKRILLLERQHGNLSPKDILNEIDKRKSSFPDLAHVDEIWILETIFYGTAFGGTYFRCELYRDGRMIRGFDFVDGALRVRGQRTTPPRRSDTTH
jgi:hypothetical protein